MLHRRLSFRDPSSRLYIGEDRVFRFIEQESSEHLRAFVESNLASHLVAEGKLTPAWIRSGTREIPSSLSGLAEDASLILEHERLPFISYPYEWSAGMLSAAAHLTLELASRALPKGYLLKDATPYNVLFRGPRPVFVDWASFEPHDPHASVWLPYAQFVRCFLLPLLAHRRLGIHLQAQLMHFRDGLVPDTVYSWLSVTDRLIPPALQLVTAPTWLRNLKFRGLYAPRRESNPTKARFILERLFHSLEVKLRKLQPAYRKPSEWTTYTTGGCNYGQDQLAQKESFVREAVAICKPHSVLDIGCNTGHFSLLAIECGAREVVAIDNDAEAIEALWRRASATQKCILPLVVNFARPTPPVGWRNQECLGFLERARNRFDCVFMLALIHHLVISERIPLEEIFSLAAELTRSHLVIEFVGRQDAMFQCLLRGRAALHADWCEEMFEHAATNKFRIVRKVSLSGSERALYVMAKV